jgi:hypothetical protein
MRRYEEEQSWHSRFLEDSLDSWGGLMSRGGLRAGLGKPDSFSLVASPRRRVDYAHDPAPKVIFPSSRSWSRFQPGRDAIRTEPRILFGVHFYDIKAIDMLDALFRENNEDWNYLAQREATTIVGSASRCRAFWDSG